MQKPIAIQKCDGRTDQPTDSVSKRGALSHLKTVKTRPDTWHPVADGLAGAVRKPLGIQKCDGQTDIPTYRPTRQGVESRVRD